LPSRRNSALTSLPVNTAQFRRNSRHQLTWHPRRPSETVVTSMNTLSGRDRAILRAVAAGGAELRLGAEPDLFLDGRCCCDQSAAHHLVHAGLIAATALKLVSQRVPAALPPAGRQALDMLVP